MSKSDPLMIDWEFWEDMLLKIHQVKDWVEYWNFEEELADQIYDHLRLAAYKMGAARANLAVDEAFTPHEEDI